MKNHMHNHHKHQSNHSHNHDNNEVYDAEIVDESSKKGIIRNIVTVLLIVILLTSWWYGFGKSYAAVKSVTLSAKTGIASVFHFAQSETANESMSDKTSNETISDLATADSDNSLLSWDSRKSHKGDSIWGVYSSSLENKDSLSYRNQIVNGLTNITILKNNIAQDNINNNSMKEGNEYWIINSDAQQKFTNKIIEANKQLESGKSLKDLDNSLSLAYQIANSSSHSFIYTVQINDIQKLIE